MSMNWNDSFQRRIAGMFLAVVATVSMARADETWVIRCGRIETGTGQVIEGGTILVVDGVIRAVGRDLEVPVGAHELDARSLTVTPAFVYVGAAYGQDRSRSSGNSADDRAETTFYPYVRNYQQRVREGIVTLSLESASRISGIGGMAAVVRVTGENGSSRPGAVLHGTDTYLKIGGSRWTTEKDTIRKGFEKVDESIQKLEEAKKKWEEKQKEKEKKEKEKKDDEKKSEEKKEEPKEEFKPPRVDDKTAVLWRWEKKEIQALVELDGAGSYLHWKQVLGERDVRYCYYLGDGVDHYRVADSIHSDGVPVLMLANVGSYPGTANLLNAPAVFEQAGCEVGFTPSEAGFRSAGPEQWRFQVAQVVKAGFPREKAIGAMSRVPAKVLGVDSEIGSIEPGRLADLILWTGDPLDVRSEIDRVLVAGRVVYTKKTDDESENR